MRLFKYSFSLLCMTLFLSSCFKFDGDETVPTYIYIPQSFKVVSNPELNNTEGTLSSLIVDAKLVIDERVVGNFELPATCPALFSGSNHTIKIRPGIKMNGIANSRISYPFYKDIILKNINLIPGKTITIPDSLLITSYIEDVVFPFIEDFEGSGMHFPVPMKKITESNGNHIGHIQLNRAVDSVDFFDIEADVTHKIKNTGYCFLEMDFKCDHEIRVGLSALGSTVTKVGILMLNPTGGVWKKIYVNLTPTINEYYSTSKNGFQLIMSTELDANENTANFYFDNMKIVHNKQ